MSKRFYLVSLKGKGSDLILRKLQEVVEMLQLILGENSFSFNGRNYLQTHGTAMDTKMAVAFANIFMSEVETEILKASDIKPIQWKRYIDDVFSLWGCERDKIQLFIKEANKHHATIKFTAEISESKRK